jgi:hypothetical protein
VNKMSKTGSLRFCEIFHMDMILARNQIHRRLEVVIRSRGRLQPSARIAINSLEQRRITLPSTSRILFRALSKPWGSFFGGCHTGECHIPGLRVNMDYLGKIDIFM